MPQAVHPPPFDPAVASPFVDDLDEGIHQTSYSTAAAHVVAQPNSPPVAFPQFAAQSTVEPLPGPNSYEPDPNTVYPLQESPQVFYADGCGWTWQVLPDGLMYKSYMAGTREARISGALLYDTERGWLLDAALGGRRGILRYGTAGANDPNGWQLDIEGAAFVRLNVEEEWDVDGADFRFGVPLTYRSGPWQWKTGYYHLSAHVGDEFLERNPGFTRINYVRDAIILGLGYYFTDDIRLYGEAGWAFHTDGGAEPFEFQFGADYSPAVENGFRGSPYAAFNVHLREEVDYGGGINVMAGWRWKGPISDSTFRAGVQYYNGKSTQYSFFNQNEELIGFGLWYDY